MNVRVGTGFDIHRLVPGRPLIIGGVLIPYSRGLEGHSDGDALFHAITDALLGAAGLGNIGEKFPDTDPAHRDADSTFFLRQTARMLRDRGLKIGNVDSNILAEEPRLSPYFAEMAANASAALDIEAGQVQVKAKTMEGLGVIGRGDAIAAQAVVLLYAS